MAITLKLDTVEYVLKSDRKAAKEEKTLFHLRPLLFRERTAIQDSLIETETAILGPKNAKKNTSIQRIKLGEQMEKAILAGIEKIENLKDPAGKVIPYHRNMESKKRVAVLDVLRVEWCQELSQEILRISGMGADEEKN